MFIELTQKSSYWIVITYSVILEKSLLFKVKLNSSPWGLKESKATEHELKTHLTYLTVSVLTICNLESTLINSTFYVLKLEKAMAPHSSTLAWKIPWIEEPGRLQSMRSLRVGHD